MEERWWKNYLQLWDAETKGSSGETYAKDCAI
jgi:hypothetical protein